MPPVPCVFCALVPYVSRAIYVSSLLVSFVPPALRTVVSHMRGVLRALLPHMPCFLLALMPHTPHLPRVYGFLGALASHMSCSLCASRASYLAFSCASRPLYIFLKLKPLEVYTKICPTLVKLIFVWFI